MKKHILGSLALIGAFITAPASATVSVGDAVTCGGVNLECSVDDAVVGSGSEFGIEFDVYGTTLNADFSAGLLTISFNNNTNLPDGAAMGGLRTLSFSNRTDPFTYAELGDVNKVVNFDADLNTFAFDPNNISFDAGFVTINLSNTYFAPDSSLQVRFDRGTTPPTDAVPEPATWAMMILGFGLVGAAIRRRKTATIQPLFA